MARLRHKLSGREASFFIGVIFAQGGVTGNVIGVEIENGDWRFISIRYGRYADISLAK